MASAKAAISRTPSLPLSPSKRRKIEGEQLSRTGNYDTRESTGRAQDEEHPQPTATDILRWTFTKAAIASCFVRDVLEMKESGMKGTCVTYLARRIHPTSACRRRHGVLLVGPNPLSNCVSGWARSRSASLGETYRIHHRRRHWGR